MMTENSGKELIANMMRRCGTALLFTAFVSFFLSLLQLVVPLYMLQIYDRVMNSRSIDTLVMLTVIAVGGLIVFAVLDYIRARAYLILGEILARRLNVPVLQAAITESLQKHSSQGAQALRDVNDLRLFVTSNAFGVPLDAIWAPMFFVVLFLLHPAYGVVALIGGIALLLLGVTVELVSRKALAQANDASNRALGIVTSSIRNAEIIEALGMLHALAQRWQQMQQRAITLLGRGNSGARAVAAASKSVRMSVQIFILAIGAYLVIEREASPGSFVAASIIMARALFPFEQLIDGWRQWVFAAGAFNRVRTLLMENANLRQRIPLPVPEGRLVADRVVFVPPGSDRPVLKGVSFTLEPGEVVGVIGPSGAGKSTLARLIMGIWQPTSGGIYLDGQNVFLWERESFGRHVGYLPQNVALIEGTVRDNIARFSHADPLEIVEAARAADVHELIGRLPFGYDTEIRDVAFNLSGGQRQRLALARALFGKPRLLVLDEPNSNLDHAGEQALLRAIVAAKKAGTTVVLIAHRPSVISVVDKILVLKDGTVEQFGPRTEIIQSVVPGATPARTAPRPVAPANGRAS